MTKSSECKSDLVKGLQRLYTSTGKHMLLINCRVTFSKATRPTFDNTAFAALVVKI